MKPPIQSVEVSYHVHATEDLARIQRGVEEVIGQAAEPETESLEGHFGNKIVSSRILLTGDPAWLAFRSVLLKMPAGVLREIAEDAESYIDEHSAMFLRFDKQALVGGSLALGTADAVRLKIKPRAYLTKGGAPSFYRGLMKVG